MDDRFAIAMEEEQGDTARPCTPPPADSRESYAKLHRVLTSESPRRAALSASLSRRAGRRRGAPASQRGSHLKHTKSTKLVEVRLARVKSRVALRGRSFGLCVVERASSIAPLQTDATPSAMEP